MEDFNISPDIKQRQRALILAVLAVKPTGTIEFREAHGIAHPAGRVLELRKLKHSISTLSTTVFDAAGRLHRSAVYRLDCAADTGAEAGQVSAIDGVLP